MNYTKGPWTADDTSVKCGRDMIASVFDPKDTCHRTPIGMANAVLISTAPDMYEALVAIAKRPGEAAGMMRREGFVLDNLDDRWQKLAFTLYTMLVESGSVAEATITKAEGKA